MTDTWNTNEFEVNFRAALVPALDKLCERFNGAEVRRLDVGVFPWHGTVEISVLLNGDVCSPDDIASWPNYNAAGLQSGLTPPGLAICDAMQKRWINDHSVSTIYFQLVGKLLQSEAVRLMGKLNQDGLEVTLFDPDDPQSSNFAQR